MNKSRQFIVLTFLVVFPILVFVFLQSFGTNTYPLQVFHTQWIEELPFEGQILRDTVQDASLLKGKKIVDTLYHRIPDFALTDQHNRPFQSKQLEGAIYVADFFFTRCGNPTLCPRMSQELKRVQENFKDQEMLKLVSFTVDPSHDTPEVLKEYAGRYQAQEGKWFFLTGEKKKIYDLAFDGFKVNAMEEDVVVKPDFLHAIKFILVDKEGRIRGYYNGTEREDVDRLILEIKILLHEYKQA
ncbi:MAG: hypothetical protein OHK0053_06030 [Microscillaceae bacterium]